jgi:hypothetical protein
MRLICPCVWVLVVATYRTAGKHLHFHLAPAVLGSQFSTRLGGSSFGLPSGRRSMRCPGRRRESRKAQRNMAFVAQRWGAHDHHAGASHGGGNPPKIRWRGARRKHVPWRWRAEDSRRAQSRQEEASQELTNAVDQERDPTTAAFVRALRGAWQSPSYRSRAATRWFRAGARAAGPCPLPTCTRSGR